MMNWHSENMMREPAKTEAVYPLEQPHLIVFGQAPTNVCLPAELYESQWTKKKTYFNYA